MSLLVFASLALASSLVFAQGEIETQRVRFDEGASSAVVESTLEGYETIDYLIGARQGQHANIRLATRHTATYFNLLAPGEMDVAFFIGSTSGNQFEGTLPASGDYRIRVYMMRSAARRGESASYRLEVAIAPGAIGSTARTGDALVPGTTYHATGNVPCAMREGQATGSCPFGVEREGNGNAAVTVTKPDGSARTIFFERGQATGYDASQADRGAFRAAREGDLTIVRIGGERYEIPDAVVEGG